MKRVATFLVALVAVSTANPVFQAFFAEIQVAPDSLERLEVNPANWEYYPFDLSGCEISTNAGTATINDGVVVPDESTPIVIDRSNVTGTFSLGDSGDSIELRSPGGSLIWFLLYPYSGRGNPMACWLPPPGASCAMQYYYGFWPWDVEGGTWYMDETPTFGALNDDTVGGITGIVYDDRLLPVPDAWVHFSGPHGGADAYTDQAGVYRLHPTGPVTFQVSAQKREYLPGYYPESVRVAANQWVDSINILLARVGVSEHGLGPPGTIGLHLSGRTLVLQSSEPGPVQLVVFDDLGRVRMSKEVALVAGSCQLALPGLRSGIYFASCRSRERTSNAKLVLY